MVTHTRGMAAAAPAVASAPGPVGAWLRANPAHIVDVFVYVIVLNLAAEYLPDVISEGFTMSLLTAILLKVVLEVVVAIKVRIKGHLKAATGTRRKVLIGLGLWAVAAGSKFVVLELENLLLGDAVSLGGFFSVTALIVCLLLSRAGVRKLLGAPLS